MTDALIVFVALSQLAFGLYWGYWLGCRRMRR
jgi:hypothetical protein